MTNYVIANKIILSVCIIVAVKCIFGLPITIKLPETIENDGDDDDFDDEIYKLSYKKYLKEVMSLLMTDEAFKKKIMTEGKRLADKAKEFSTNLDFISHNIRSRLDELKRKELERLRNLMKLKAILKQSLKNLTHEEYEMNTFEKERLLGHLDHLNVNSFEAADLEKLIIQTSKDLEELDRKRKEAFKVYEMEKELEMRRILGEMDGETRQKEEEKRKMMEDKHKNHSKMHHPVNKAHLLDVWENMDGMDRNDFDKKTFFHIHDVNGDGLWDHNEVEALFQKELDKVYDKDAPEDDWVERFEEMSRMREHFISEADDNKDGVVSFLEFILYSSREEFQQDDEWKAINKNKEFNEDDLKLHKVKLDKLKLQSREGLEEDLSVEIGIFGSTDKILFKRSNQSNQLKFQQQNATIQHQDIVKQNVKKNLSSGVIKQAPENLFVPAQTDQAIKQAKVEN